MPKFRKKPIVIEARRFRTDAEASELAQWCGGQLHLTSTLIDIHLVINIPTLEGTMRAEPGDWIVRGVAGEFYPCRDDIFTATYEPVEDSAELTDLGFPTDEAIELRGEELAAALDVCLTREQAEAKLAEWPTKERQRIIDTLYGA